MRFLFILFFFILGCNSLNGEKTSKIYICGDHECASKKEIDDYFKNNISIEVYSISRTSKKDMDYDLVELNMSKDEKDKIITLASRKKDIKEDLKKRKEIAKTEINNNEVISQIKKTNKKRKVTLVRICKSMLECDIDEVAKTLFKEANKKKYPNLSVE
tara:strand:+ start:65 stop:541 length:477 start_codon:yes stop_codon:yes gene_type:complete